MLVSGQTQLAAYPVHSAMSESKPLLEAQDRDSLVSQLDARREEILGRQPGACDWEDEFWYLYHYLTTVRPIEFPITVSKRERPDFLVKSGPASFGLEMTSIHSEDYEKNVAEYEKCGLTDGPYFVPPAERLVDMKNPRHRENLKKGLSERGSALDRVVVGEIRPDEIKTYVDQIARGLVRKVNKLVTYEFTPPITIAVGIESTRQHRSVAWHPAGIPKESMAEILLSLTRVARWEMEQHPMISGICFIANRRVLMVPRNGAYCGDRQRFLPVNQYLDVMYS